MNLVKFIFLVTSVLLVLCTINSKSSENSSDEIVNPIDSGLTPITTLDSILTPITTLEDAYANQISDISVIVKGSITKLLSDDVEGDQHQRFIIRMSNNQTLLIAHNIDIGARVTGIKIGSVVYVHGDYVWNDEGGLIHWTHRDPSGIHEDGWIDYNSTKFE